MNDSLIVGLLIAGVVILWLIVRLASVNQRVNSAKDEASRVQNELARLSGHIQQEAMSQFQAWRQKEFEDLKREQAEVAAREARVQLDQWKVASEAAIRSDAIQRSRSTTVGKVTEHIVPYLPDFSYNPKDARFIGSPVDFIVFDGLDDEAVKQVVFVEVKTGAGYLTTRERQVRDAILSRKVKWEETRITAPSQPAKGTEAQDPKALAAAQAQAPVGAAEAGVTLPDGQELSHPEDNRAASSPDACASCGHRRRFHFMNSGCFVKRCWCTHFRPA